MLGDIPSVAFKVTNFTRQNMQVLEGRWESIKTALTRAVTLVSEFGFSEHSLTAHNAVLPIAHYLYRGMSTRGISTKRTEARLNGGLFDPFSRRVRGAALRIIF